MLKSMDEWNEWPASRPTEAGLYWWRVLSLNEGGIVPEFVAEHRLVGMGYDANQLWPIFSHWNGYSRTVPGGTQWRTLTGDEKDGQFLYPGLTLEDCPFCGRHPNIEWCNRSGSGIWIGAPIFRANSFNLRCRCRMAQTVAYHHLADAAEAWNRRFDPARIREIAAERSVR